MKALFKMLLVFGLFLVPQFINRIAYSQRVSAYTVSTFTGTFTSIATFNGGSGTLATSGDDVTASITNPFSWIYDNQAVTSMSINTNGTIGIDQSAYCCQYTDYLGTTSYPSEIDPYQVDMYVNSTSSSPAGGLFYQTQGSAPSRKLVVEWAGIRAYSGNSTYSSFQVIIYEGTNMIEFLYKDKNFLFNNSSTAGIGLNGRTTPTFAYVRYGSSTKQTPATDVRFSPIPPINVQLGVQPFTHQYNFGSLATGSSGIYSITVQNVGDNSAGIAKLSIRSVSITGDPDFSIVSVPVSSDSMSIGETRQIVVKFAPVLDGIRSAGITINSNGKDSGTQTFALSGIGLAPLISVDTNVLFKNKFVKMGDSMIARVMISSTNSPTLFISKFQFVGIDSGEYRIYRTPATTILGGTADSLLVVYKPTKEGRHVATLNIINNSINNPVLPITLFGTAILPHIVVTPTPLRFDSVLVNTDSCKTIRIYNPGTDTLLIKSNGFISSDPDFRYTPLAGQDTIIPPDRFKDVTVCFKPIQKGTRVARLRLATNIIKTFEKIPRDTAGQFLIDITGTGVPSSSLGQSIGFGEPNGWMDSVLLGKSICTDDSLTNTGDADILITSIGFSGTSAADYSVNGLTLPYILKAKSKVIIHICATPKARGLRDATLEIKGTMNEKAFTSKATLAITGLATCAQAIPSDLFTNTLIPLGDSTLTVCDTVTNCGDITANYTASVVGNLASDYTVTPPTANNIAPGGTAIFCVTYKPSNRGISNASLKITTADTPDQTVGLSGSGGCSHLTASLGPDALGPFGKGGHYTITVNIQNTGEIDWVPDAGNPFVIGTDAGLLTANTPALGTITAGGNAQVTFDFHPGNTNTPFSIPIGFVGGPCRDTTGVLFSGTTNDAKVNDPVAKQGFVLGVNHPNPFAGATQFTYTTPTEASVTLSLRDVTGKLIRTISNGPVSSGEHTVVFNAGELSSGNYLLMLESGDVTLMRQVIIAK
jgi:hypothetical protein